MNAFSRYCNPIINQPLHCLTMHIHHPNVYPSVDLVRAWKMSYYILWISSPPSLLVTLYRMNSDLIENTLRLYTNASKWLVVKRSGSLSCKGQTRNVRSH